jgi:hypothetical protein
MRTAKTTTATVNEELDVMSKTDLLIVKAGIILFIAVLNICFFTLF